MDLRYVDRIFGEELNVGECTIRKCMERDGLTYRWVLWFRVANEVNGDFELFAVPVRLGAPEVSPEAIRHWGLTRVDAHTWQVTPSINVRRPNNEGPSLWHQTPRLVCVPENLPWQ